MSLIKIKAFYMVRFPANGKLSNVEIQNIKILELNLYQNDGSGSYSKLFDALNRLFSLKLVYAKDIITCYSDQDNYLISLETDKELMGLVRNNKQSIIDIYFCIKNFQGNNQSSSASSNKNLDSTTLYSNIFSKSNANIKDEHLIHINVICNECRGQIYGNRFVCSRCDDYDLCQSCREKGVHQYHTFNKIKPWDLIFKGWNCDSCGNNNIRDECFVCIDCSKQNFNKMNYFVVCQKCKPNHSSAHGLEKISAKTIVSSLTSQILQVKNLKLKGYKPPIFNGFSCNFCKSQSVSFKAYNLFGKFYPLCELCFLSGMSSDISSKHSILTSHDAYELNQTLEQNRILKLQLENMQKQSDRELKHIEKLGKIANSVDVGQPKYYY